MKHIGIEIDGKEFKGFAQKIKGELWVHFQGKTYTFKPQNDLQQGQSQQGVIDPNIILAPMPGKVIKVLKAVGEAVLQGETLVVLEAMKMEYNLKSAKDGQVQSVLCQEGQQVELGVTLMELE